MIVGPGWGFLGLLAVGLVAFALIPGCGLVVAAEAPTSGLRLDAPPLVELDPAVEAVPAGVRTVSGVRTQRQVRRGSLRVTSPDCQGQPAGAGFALDKGTLLAQRTVLSGASTLRVGPRQGRARSLRAVRVYRLGELGIALVERQLPRTLPSVGDVPLGTSVAVVGYPLAVRPRLLRGVVVDRVAGARFGIRGRVLRLTSTLRPGDPGGPVLDGKGRIVAVAFATDPRTGLAVAVPLRTLASLVSARSLEALGRCDDG